ncbi:Embryogenesis-associated protein EMB8 [Bienertia sinuspersici]
MARLDSHSLLRFRHLPSPLTTHQHLHLRLYVTRPKPKPKPKPSFTSPISSMSAQPQTVQVHPSLEVIGGGRAKFLPALRKNLEQPYNPFPVFGWNRHVETIFAAFFRSLPEVKFKRECLRTEDDGAVALDWVAGDHLKLPPLSPILILLFYSASFTGDLTEVIAHVSGRYPKARLYAVGWSLGANILVRYLGQESHDCSLAGAVSLCNPFNLPIADEDFHKGFNNVYDKALANSLCKIFKRHATLFEDIGGEYNIPMAANAKTENQNCLLIITPNGGHLGWVAGDGAPFGAPWTDPCVIEFLQHLETLSSEASSSSRQVNEVVTDKEDLLAAEV